MSLDKHERNHDRLPTKDAWCDCERRLEDFAAVGCNWFWEVDRDFRLTFLSSQWEAFTGLKRQDSMGKRLDEVWREIGLSEEFIQQNVAVLKKRPDRLQFDRLLTLPNGQISDIRVRGQAFRDSGGAIIGYRGVGFDLTAERRIKAELTRAKEEAEFANRAKSEFLANMSHELRTPLNSILGFSEVMKDEILGPIGSSRYHTYAQDIHASASYLLDIINDILDLAKIEAGEVTLRETIFNVRDVVESCHRMLQERAEAAGLRLSYDVEDGVTEIYADRIHIKQMILNLSANAIKFTPMGGVVRIAVRKRADGGVNIAVEDDGIGMAPKDVPSVMQPFNQVEPAQSRGHKGTGLGLALTKSLIEAHDGALTIASALGAGAVVTCALPPERSAFDESAPAAAAQRTG